MLKTVMFGLAAMLASGAYAGDIRTLEVKYDNKTMAYSMVDDYMLTHKEAIVLSERNSTDFYCKSLNGYNSESKTSFQYANSFSVILLPISSSGDMVELAVNASVSKYKLKEVIKLNDDCSYPIGEMSSFGTSENKLLKLGDTVKVKLPNGEDVQISYLRK